MRQNTIKKQIYLTFDNQELESIIATNLLLSTGISMSLMASFNLKSRLNIYLKNFFKEASQTEKFQELKLKLSEASYNFSKTHNYKFNDLLRISNNLGGIHYPIHYDFIEKLILNGEFDDILILKIPIFSKRNKVEGILNSSFEEFLKLNNNENHIFKTKLIRAISFKIYSNESKYFSKMFKTPNENYINSMNVVVNKFKDTYLKSIAARKAIARNKVCDLSTPDLFEAINEICFAADEASKLHLDINYNFYNMSKEQCGELKDELLSSFLKIVTRYQ